jgi:hypothetical protein
MSIAIIVDIASLHAVTVLVCAVGWDFLRPWMCQGCGVITVGRRLALESFSRIIAVIVV